MFINKHVENSTRIFLTNAHIKCAFEKYLMTRIEECGKSKKGKVIFRSTNDTVDLMK